MRQTPVYVPIKSALRSVREGRWSDAWFHLLCGIAMLTCDALLVVGPLLFLLLFMWLSGALP